ncbi:GTPase-activating protein gyp1 (GAP for ypt1) [Durusdinium trenchii]|uniref:GTPase-activating protein gyp1 (GAP for ypt1) n=1 Tax=Durusdinium trenchii TaxID=1381693 RepID=A0ABP0P6T8_9DINO
MQSASSTGTQRSAKAQKFHRLLSLPTVDLAALRELLWSGAPEEDPKVRAQSWQMLLGYLPPVQDRQPSGLQKKREEYEELRRRHYLPVEAEAPSGDVDGAILRQIRLDIPRTSPGLPIFGHQRIQQLLERILFIWSLRHPASGYVQGINDLATPFVVVLLASELDCLPEEINVDAASDDTLDAVEAGAYWCLTKFLSDIQDHYTSGQPGIQQMVAKLREIVHRIDQKLYDHLEEQGLDFLQLSFRWMNCLLLREFPFPCVIRLWDTYIAEPLEGFSSFHVYVCAVFLIYWSPQLKQMDYQQLMLFMQKLPTGKWRNQEIETLLAEAFVLKSLFHSSPNHLNPR